MGFGFGATSVMRENRALLKKRKFKDIKELLLETSGKTEVEFKQTSATELAQIKSEIRRKAHRKAEREIMIYGLYAIILLVFFGFLFIYVFFIN
ncbi:MAG: hypothetical protein Mars2KO_37200 [Maribacter sp.]